MFKKFLLIPVICLVSITLQAATQTANKNGNWEASDTWIGSVNPGCGDSIVIPATFTVTITTALDFTGCSSPMKIVVRGNLNFQNGKKLKLPCGSRVYIYNGGSINPGSGGGSSNLIDICNTTVWQTSNGSLPGTDCLPPDPTCSSFTLPVEFNGFSAVNSGKKIRLQWFTASEKDNDLFTIERAGSNGIFTQLSKVKGAGNSHIIRAYLFDDMSPLDGTSFYRIKQTDFNGKSSYSGTVAIKRQKEITINIFPNPSKGSFYVEIGGGFDGEKVNITVEDQTGRIIYNEEMTDHGDNFKISLENSHPNGIYIVTIKGDACVFTQRIAISAE